jgi:hypothetical protein
MSRRERGCQAMASITIMTPIMIGFFVLAIDGGRLLTAYLKPHGLADAAAVAAAWELHGSADVVENASATNSSSKRRPPLFNAASHQVIRDY